jgi:hypothetical protein
MAYSIPDWASMLGFAWGVVATGVAWRQADKRRQDADTALAFLHGLKPSIEAANLPAVLAQINDQMARIQPPTTGDEIVAARRLRTLGGMPMIAALGAIIGLSATLLAVNLWPRVTLAPAILTVSDLRIGVDEDGKPALCDTNQKAYDVGAGHGPELVSRRMKEPAPTVVNGQQVQNPVGQAICRPA